MWRRGFAISDRELALTSSGPGVTREWGRCLGRLARPGDFFALIGEIGAGKTVLAQGILEGLGVDDPLGSPTFTLIHEYRGRRPAYHVDLYRLGEAARNEDLGLEELFHEDGVTVVEWADFIKELWPEERVEILMERSSGKGAGGRKMLLCGRGARGAALVGMFREDVKAAAESGGKDGSGC